MSNRILTYDDVKSIPLGSNDEPLVKANKYDARITCQYKKFDMFPWTGFDILVRDSVARKLATANAALKIEGFGLKVVYGYRSPSVQKQYFDKRFKALRAENLGLNDEELLRLTHSYVAVPDSAGHTLGAAVDITIGDCSGNECDMGTAIADYSDPMAIQSGAKVGASQTRLRRLLQKVMLDAGFAPFLGEWWHFSYGDKEWAAYYGVSNALYGQVDISVKSSTLTIAGGNKTVLQVAETWYGESLNRQACEALMSLKVNIEQAGIFYRDINKLVMAGGEFCGNATAAVATLLKNGKQPLFYGTSGLENEVTAIIVDSSKENDTVHMSFQGIKYNLLNEGSLCVDFGGIIHVLVEDDFPSNYEEEAIKVRERLRLSDRDAVGVIWYRRIGSGRADTNPVVWVRDIDTLFYETSCGSGAMAVAVVLGVSNVRQPTGEDIGVVVTSEGLETVSEVRCTD